MTTPFVITGATIPPNQPQGLAAPNRLEINNFVKDKKFFSLYIQALDRMQKLGNENDLLSFYQLGGIHGYPYIVWNGSGETPEDPDDQWGGYCTHGSVLFPTWHRPYVALFEQIIQKHAVDIAAEYKVDQDAWKSAAANLRQPYWDWAATAVPPTEVYKDEEVKIIGFDGKETSFKPNPFLRYRFRNEGPQLPAPFDEVDTTLRYPSLNSQGQIVSDPQRFSKVLTANERDIADKTWHMFMLLHEWPLFSNHTDNPSDRPILATSLEGIHDSMHDNIGGTSGRGIDSKLSGTMQWPEYAGFDPIFFLHHSNTDRLLSLWGALNPDKWVAAGTQEGGTVTIPPNGKIDSNSPLTPFWNTTQTYWPSSTLTDTAKLGYTYPDFNGLTGAQIPQAILRFVNMVYGRFTNQPIHPQSFGSAQVNLAAFAAPSATPAEPSENQSNIVYVPDWSVEISFKQFELDVSFAVMVFLGQVPEDSYEWAYAKSYVGSVHGFVNSLAKKGACANCQGNINAVTSGHVHLNNALLEAGYNPTDRDEITGLVKSGTLTYRVLKNDNTEAELPSLKVSINHVPLQQRVGSSFPEPNWEHPGDQTAPGPIKIAF